MYGIRQLEEAMREAHIFQLDHIFVEKTIIFGDKQVSRAQISVLDLGSPVQHARNLVSNHQRPCFG